MTKPPSLHRPLRWFRSQHTSATRMPRQRPRPRTKTPSPPQKKSAPTARGPGTAFHAPVTASVPCSVPGLAQEAVPGAMRPCPMPRPPPQKNRRPRRQGGRVSITRRQGIFFLDGASEIAPSHAEYCYVGDLHSGCGDGAAEISLHAAIWMVSGLPRHRWIHICIL